VNSSAPRASIRRQLNLVVAISILLALALAGLGLATFDLRRQSQAITHDLAAQAEIIGLASSAALAFDDAKGAAENLAALRANPAIAVAVLYGEREPLAVLGGQPAPARPPTAHGSDIDGQWIRVWRPVRLRGESLGTVYVQARHGLVARGLEQLAVLAVIMGLSLAAALAFANRRQRLLIQPLQELAEVAQGIRRGEFHLRAWRRTSDEVGDLVDAFNAMVDELERRARTLEAANAAFAASEERYQLAVRGSSAGLWDWNLAGNAMFYSPRLKALLGYTDEEFPNRPQSIRLVADEADLERVREALHRHFTEGAPYQVELRVRLKSGAYRWLLVAGASLRDAQGQPFRMAGSVIDVTERRLAENVLRDSNRAKDEFLATLAHELRNPLAPIRTGLAILKRDTGNTEVSRRARATMERQLHHLVRLIDDLLDISRITSGKIRIDKARLRLRSAIDSAIEISRPLLEASGHGFELHEDDPGIEVEGDATRLAQSIGNLLNNAAKYTPPGGRIRMRVWREGDEAHIAISDNGVGIPPDMIEQVFSMFTQVGKTLDRAQGGLGIGLALVRSLVGLHGGSVRAESEGLDRGSTFTIILPCVVGEASARDETQPLRAALRGGCRVLVVDDNQDAALTLADVLQMFGHATRVVHRPEDVLPAAKAFSPDAVLLDIGLPGASGYEVARWLRAGGYERTLLIAVTGWGAESDREQTRAAGFDHHLTKPVDVDALLHLLQPALPRE
jgi:PAS domain S-box-containing protein